MLNCLVVTLGGGLGACARYLIGLVPIKEPFSFPVKTLFINFLGCFVIGLIAAFAVFIFNEYMVYWQKGAVYGLWPCFTLYNFSTSCRT